jgi:hypothetical protein
VIEGFNESCYKKVVNKLGYRYGLVSGIFPKEAKLGTEMTFTLRILNSGYASVYSKRTVYLVLRNTVSNKEYSFPLKADPRFWARCSQQKISEHVFLPTSMIAGSYKMFLNLPDSSPLINTRPDYSIRLANDGIWEATTGYNNLLYTLNIIHWQPKPKTNNLN